MKTALVTGGAGFIGSHLVRRLLQEGFRVVAVDNLLTGDEKNISDLSKNEGFIFLHQDVITLTDEVFAGTTFSHIFHLASPASPNHHSTISYHALPMETMLVNTRGTLTMLKLAKKNNARFLFTSTSEVYGDPLVHPQTEEYRGNVSTTGPRSVYDESKRFGETLTSYFQRDHGIDTRIARIFNTFGPNMSKKDMRMIIVFINHALQGKPITIFGDGTQTRSLCYIDDMVEGLMRLMFTDNLSGEVINLGTNVERTVLEYANLIKKFTNSKSEIVFSEKLPQDDPKRRKPDITKAKEKLSWEPTVSFEEGLKKTVEYFQS